MKRMSRMLDLIKFAAGGGIIASALANVSVNNLSDSANLVVAVVGIILSIAFFLYRSHEN